jgi:hypothetical protein
MDDEGLQLFSRGYPAIIASFDPVLTTQHDCRDRFDNPVFKSFAERFRLQFYTVSHDTIFAEDDQTTDQYLSMIRARGVPRGNEYVPPMVLYLPKPDQCLVLSPTFDINHVMNVIKQSNGNRHKIDAKSEFASSFILGEDLEKTSRREEFIELDWKDRE